MPQTIPRADGPAPSPALAPPPGNPRFGLFDGLRGVAVLAVLALHAAELSGRVGIGPGGRVAEAAGGLGVIVFFVISGFLLYRPFAAAHAAGRPGPAIARYARRRALRILPAYWIVLTILAVFPGVTGVFSDHWWRYYGLLQAYFPGATASGIPVAWTLCVEVSFYVALPVWAAALAARRTRSRRSFAVSELTALTGLAALGLVVQVLAARQLIPATLGSTLPGESLWFALGMALAVGSVLDPGAGARGEALERLAERPLVCWAASLAALAGLAALVPAGGIFGLAATVTRPQHSLLTVLRLALEAIVVVGLVVPAAFAGRRPGLPRRILGCRALVGLGIVSYSFYLWHLTLVEFVALGSSTAFAATGLALMAHVATLRMTVLFAVGLAAATLLATVSYRFVELPFLRLKDPRPARAPRILQRP